MRIKLQLAVIAAFLLVAFSAAFAGGEKVIYTTNGEKFTGRILKQDDKLVTLRITGGTATIPIGIIDKIVDLIDQAKFQLLVVNDKKLADRLYQELSDGSDFTGLVKKHSMHLSYFKDGMTDFVDRSYLPEKVAKDAFDLRINGYIPPVQVDESFYIVKLLGKRKTEKGDPQDKEPQETAPPEEPVEPAKKSSVKIAVLLVVESTHEARVAATGVDLQELLASEIDATTGLETFLADKAPEPDDENAPEFVISGEVAKSGAAYAVQFVLKDRAGKELFTTDRLTAVCPADTMDDLFGSIKQLAESLIREIRKPR